MVNSRQSRVIVGVVDSLAGLRAIREAVAQARNENAQLIAVGSFTEPIRDTTPFHGLIATSQVYGVGLYEVGAHAQQEMERQQRIARRNAIGAIRALFDKALGGVPPDICVRLVTTTDKIDMALVQAAHDDRDLIVVPMQRRLRRRFTRKVARLGCRVLLVPPHEFARNPVRRRRIDPESIIAAHEKANRQ